MTDKKTAPVDVDGLVAFLNKLSPEQMQTVMQQTGQQPSTQGFTPELLATILQTSGRDAAIAARKADQRENPDYPARSVFNTRGRYDDDGNALAPKLKFTHDTYFGPVLIGRAGASDDLSKESEIELYNRFEHDMDAHNGTWTARFSEKGGRRRLTITVPMAEADDRMGLPGLSAILLTLLEGEESVNPVNMRDEILSLKAKMAALEAGGRQAPASETPVEASLPA